MRFSTKVFLIVLISISTQAKTKLAITIDDLPKHSDIAPEISRLEVARHILEALKKNAVPEVYGFVNAESIASDPSLVEVLKLWTSYGYPLGNHTYSHQDLNKTSIEDFKKEIEKNEATLKTYGSQFDWKFFRYPFLHEGNSFEKRNAIRAYLKEKSYKIAEVSVDFGDWSWNEPYVRCVNKKDREQIEWLKKTYLKCAKDQLHREEQIGRALFKKDISHILLLHIGAFDSVMIDELLKLYKKEGVEFVSLSEAVKDPIYNLDPKVIGEWGSEFTSLMMISRKMKIEDVGLKVYTEYPDKKLSSICR